MSTAVAFALEFEDEITRVGKRELTPLVPERDVDAVDADGFRAFEDALNPYQETFMDKAGQHDDAEYERVYRISFSGNMDFNDFLGTLPRKERASWDAAYLKLLGPPSLLLLERKYDLAAFAYEEVMRRVRAGVKRPFTREEQINLFGLDESHFALQRRVNAAERRRQRAEAA